MTNPYEPPQTKPEPRLRYARVRFLVLRLAIGELSTVMAVMCMVAGIVFLLWAAACAFNIIVHVVAQKTVNDIDKGAWVLGNRLCSRRRYRICFNALVVAKADFSRYCSNCYAVRFGRYLRKHGKVIRVAASASTPRDVLQQSACNGIHGQVFYNSLHAVNQ